MAQDDTYVAALRTELEGCKAAGKTDRVKAIEAEIARAGGGKSKPGPERTAATEPPAKRTRKS